MLTGYEIISMQMELSILVQNSEKVEFFCSSKRVFEGFVLHWLQRFTLMLQSNCHSC